MTARAIAQRFDNKPEMLVQVLVALVQEKGWVAEDDIRELADALNLSRAEVLGRKTSGGREGSLFIRMLVGVVLLEGILLLGRLFGMMGSVFGILGFGMAAFGWSIILIAATTGFGAFLMTRFRPAEEPAPAGAVAPPVSPAAPGPYPPGPPVPPSSPPPPGA